VRDWIDRSIAETGLRPLVFSSILSPDLRATVARANALFVDYFDTFISPLEVELGKKSSGTVGKAHGMTPHYLSRINAVNFGLTHDDGLGKHLEQAEIILIGVSRCGKTPTCLYLALQYSLYAANYPLTPDDFESTQLPAPLQPYPAKLFGLTISPERLTQIRQERKPNSDYARIDTCRAEIRQAEALFKKYAIPFLDSSRMSIEEIASSIMHQRGLAPR